MRNAPTIACLWALSGAGTIVVTWHEAISSAIQLCYLALTAIGGGAILLYQKKLSVDRENRDKDRAQEIAMELVKKAQSDEFVAASTQSALQEVHSRLDAVISQRDHMAQRNDQLFDQISHLAERIEKTRCVFPLEDGSARCNREEKPPVWKSNL